MIRWSEPPRDADTADAVRLYDQMWSIERIAALFGTNYEAMRRLIARHASPVTTRADRADDQAVRAYSNPLLPGDAHERSGT